jgi:hypothetical protein
MHRGEKICLLNQFAVDYSAAGVRTGQRVWLLTTVPGVRLTAIQQGLVKGWQHLVEKLVQCSCLGQNEPDQEVRSRGSVKAFIQLAI